MYGTGVKEERIQVELSQHNNTAISAKPEIRTGEHAAKLLEQAQKQADSWDNVSFLTKIEENYVDPRVDEWYTTLYDGQLHRDPLQAYVSMSMDFKDNTYTHTIYMDENKGYFFNQNEDEAWYRTSIDVIEPLQGFDPLLEAVLAHRNKLLATQLVDGSWQLELRLNHDEGITDFLTWTETAFNTFDYLETDDHSKKPLIEVDFFMIRLSLNPDGDWEHYFLQYAAKEVNHEKSNDQTNAISHFIMEVSLFDHNQTAPLVIPDHVLQNAVNKTQ